MANYVIVMRETENRVEFVLDDNGIFPRLFNNSLEAIGSLITKGATITDIKSYTFAEVIPQSEAGNINNLKKCNAIEAFDLYTEDESVMVIDGLSFRIIRKENRK